MTEHDNYDIKKSKFVFWEFMERTTGTKDMTITLRDLKIIATTSNFINLITFSLLEQECFHTFDIYQDLSRLILKVDLENDILILPTNFGDHILATRGSISYVYIREKMMMWDLL